MHFIAIIANLRFQDVLDILFLTFIAYHLYLWFSGTKAFKALIGLLVLGIVFTLARTWGLFMTTWVFQIFWQVLIILLIILFQSEIRQVLERFNPLQVFGLRKLSRPEEWISGFVQAVFSLSQRKIGALIIIERGDRVEEFITEGQSIEGKPGIELLTSIFQKESPLHDGAILIRSGRVVQVAAYLPLSSDEGLPQEWGTRHRAALGLSERCDAWVVVVSEERGDISIAREKEMIHVQSSEKLIQLLTEAMKPVSPEKISAAERTKSLLLKRWQAKYGTLLLVSLLWLLLAGQQDFEVNISIPLELKNIPPKMEVLEPVKPNVIIAVRGLRKDASILNEDNVHAFIDLSLARMGRTIFPITRDHIRLPNDRIYIVRIDPPQLQFSFESKP
ncbi:diadenylate cyclase CdaA [Thermodesulfobacteriota bacterium]